MSLKITYTKHPSASRMKQNIDISEFLSDCLIFFILSPMSEGKTVSHLQIQDSGAKILYFNYYDFKNYGFLKT